RAGAGEPPALDDAGFDPELLARTAALRAAAGDAGAVPVLAAALPGIAETALRADAIDALRPTRAPPALPALEGAYDYVLTRKRVIAALAALPGGRAVLERKRQDERYPDMKAAIDAALSPPPARSR